MAYVQVKDILDMVRSFHEQLSQLYGDLSRTADDPRVRNLLEYMGRHERNMNASLAKYEADAAQGILKTWLQLVPEDSLKKVTEKKELTPSMSLETIIEQTFEFDRALLDVYQQLSGSTTGERVQEMFQNLLELEEAKEHQYARTILEMEQG